MIIGILSIYLFQKGSFVLVVESRAHLRLCGRFILKSRYNRLPEACVNPEAAWAYCGCKWDILIFAVISISQTIFGCVNKIFAGRSRSAHSKQLYTVLLSLSTSVLFRHNDNWWRTLEHAWNLEIKLQRWNYGNENPNCTWRMTHRLLTMVGSYRIWQFAVYQQTLTVFVGGLNVED